MDVLGVFLGQLVVHEVVEVEVDDGVVEVATAGQGMVVTTAHARQITERGDLLYVFSY